MKIKTYLVCFAITATILSSCKSNAEKTAGETQEIKGDSIISADSSSVTINTNSPLASDEVLLKFNPTANAAYHMVLDMHYDMVTSAMGEEMKQSMGMSMKTNMKVGGVDASGSAKLNAVYESIKMNMEMGGMKMEYESGKKTDDQMSQMMGKVFDSFINMPLTFTLDANAKVTDVTGFEAIQKKIQAQMPPEAGDMGEMNNMQESIQGSFAYLPNRPVKIGDSWEQTLETSVQQYPMTMQSTYTLSDRKDGIAIINVRSVLRSDNSKMNKEELTKMGIDDMSMSGTSTGVMQVNEATGWTEGMTMNQDIKMSVTAQGQKMPMTMKGTMKMHNE